MESDIATLFERDPLSLSEKDIQSIVEYLRKSRENFMQAGPKPARSSKEPAKKVTNLSLDDLGL